MKTIELPIYGIVVKVDTEQRYGTIASELQDKLGYNAEIDAIETLILTCAEEGVDISAPGFIRAIDRAINPILNRYYRNP